MTTLNRRVAPVAAAVLALALLAGCGSTNKPSSNAAANNDAANTDVSADGSAPGVVDPNTGAPTGAPGADPGAGGATGAPGRAGGATAGRTGGAAAGGPTAAGTKPGVEATSPGITKTEISIGVIEVRNAGAANAAFGYGGIGQIDGRKVWEAMLAEVNKNGIAGRKLKPVWYSLDATDFQTTTDTHYQRACARWTQDNKVFVAFAAHDVLNACLAKQGVVQVIGTGGGDSTTQKQYPRLFGVSGIALDRMVRMWVDRLHDRGYYKGAKLGVVTYAYPAQERATKILVEELAKRDVKPAQMAAIKVRANVVGANDEISAVRSAVLKFKTEGITHVQFVADNSAWVQLNFMQEAQNQQFFPRYGLNSNDGGQTLSVLLTEKNRPQLRGSLGVGWFPIFDVRAQDYPDSPPLKRCKQIAEAAGQSFNDATRNTEAQAGLICDALFFFERALQNAVPNLTYDGFRLGGEEVRAFPVALTFKSSMSPIRHDGVGAIRLTEWFTDCQCFKYTSGEQPV